MHRWTTVFVGALILAMIGALVWRSDRAPSTTAAFSRDAGRDDTHRSEIAPASSGASVLDDPIHLALSADGGVVLAGPATEGTDEDERIALPSGSPKMVRFGVILIQYRGAQAAAPGARSKDEAMKFAQSIAELAKTDFKAQVPKGDPGSMEDAGRIPRGVLEPAVEYPLFTMGPGATTGPIDTPRGFWIVRRIE